MPTKQSLVNRAFSNIGIASYVFDISPEEIQDAVTRLDDMMAEWDGQGIRIGYVLLANEIPSDPADESNVPDKSEQRPEQPPEVTPRDSISDLLNS